MRLIPSDGYVYLASPYSHPDPAVKEARFRAVLLETANFMKQGITVYSPIVHNHTLHVNCDMPMSWDFWQKHDLVMLAAAEFLFVLMLDGWDESIGVKAEIAEAKRLGISTIHTMAGKNICIPRS